jgi:hypothetical protein
MSPEKEHEGMVFRPFSIIKNQKYRFGTTNRILLLNTPFRDRSLRFELSCVKFKVIDLP